MEFQSIRTSAAPETYSWKVQLHEEQELKVIDEKHAGIFYPDGTQALMITAEIAHDATGKEVPTSLSVSEGKVLTLTVHHQGGGFTYPISAGPTWQTGYQTVFVAGPPTKQEEEEEKAQLIGSEARDQGSLVVGAPEFVPSNEADASLSTVDEKRKKFAQTLCGHNFKMYEGFPAAATPFASCGNAFTKDPGEGVVWHGTMRGAFFYTPGKLVRHKDAIACAKGTPEESNVVDWAMQDAYECHYGPKTTDGNGGVHASGGHYLRAQAHWVLGFRGNCRDECSPNPWNWVYDKWLELHLWPSGNITRDGNDYGSGNP